MSAVRGKSKSVCIAFTSGCPRSQMDTAWLFPYFQANGWEVVHRVEQADLVVAVACGFDAAVEDESFRRLALMRARLNGTRLIVMGCLAGINATRVSDQLNVTAVGPADVHKLDDIIAAEIPLANVPPVNDIDSRIAVASRSWPMAERFQKKTLTYERNWRKPARQFLRFLGVEGYAISAFRMWRRRGNSERIFRIRLARGCLEECSYCAIRVATGTLHSKALDDVLGEFDRGLAERYKLFELVADDIGPYGLDLSTTLPALLERMFSRKQEFSLILTDVNVRYIIKYASEMLPLLASNAARIRVLRTPVQSGSDRILALMRRGYTSAEVTSSLGELLKAAPSLPLETHVLVGFPGETDEDFQKTIELLKQVAFVKIQVYQYTDRPGTPASDMVEKVSDKIKESRIRHLLREFPQAAFYSG